MNHLAWRVQTWMCRRTTTYSSKAGMRSALNVPQGRRAVYWCWEVVGAGEGGAGRL